MLGRMADGNSNSDSQHVLITGAAGAIGAVVARTLAPRGHAVRGFDLVAMPDIPDAIVGDLADRDAVERAMQGIDTLVHLGAYPNPADFIDVLLRPNVIGLYHTMDAAVKAGVKRIIVASSMQVVSGQRGPRDQVIGTEVRAPTNDYALTKLWAEDLGQMIARQHGIEVIAVRIGFFPRGVKEARAFIQNPGFRPTFLSHDDAGRFFTAAVESPWPAADDAGGAAGGDRNEAGVPFLITYATGPGYRGEQPCDLSSARRLGYQPQDEFPAGLPFEVPDA